MCTTDVGLCIIPTNIIGTGSLDLCIFDQYCWYCNIIYPYSFVIRDYTIGKHIKILILNVNISISISKRHHYLSHVFRMRDVLQSSFVCLHKPCSYLHSGNMTSQTGKESYRHMVRRIQHETKLLLVGNVECVRSHNMSHIHKQLIKPLMSGKKTNNLNAFYSGCKHSKGKDLSDLRSSIV